MTVIDTLLQHNETFASTRFDPALKILPSRKTMIIGCVDPRVDPAEVLGLAHGEAAIIRNVGGRITPATLETLAMLRVVSQASGGDLGPGWNLIVLHHTDCGIKRLGGAPDLLGSYFGVAPTELEGLHINDPHASVTVDVAALKANPQLSGAFLVSGLVYSVTTGRIEVVVPPSLLRS
jgi:carbonic anhydrase